MSRDLEDQVARISQTVDRLARRQKHIEHVLEGRVSWACRVCGRVDFALNMEKVVTDEDIHYLHSECRRRRDGMKICPSCKGKGEVDQEEDGDE